MYGKERVYSALRLEEPDRVPITDLFVDARIVGEITGEKIVPLGFYAMPRHLREEEALPLMERNLRITAKCYRKLGFDAFIVGKGHIPMYKEKKVKWLDEYKWVGWWGDKYKVPSDLNCWSHNYMGGIFNTLEELEEHIPPDLDPEAITKAVKVVKKEVGEEMFIMALYNDAFSLATKGVGLAKFLEEIIFNRSRVERILDKVLKHDIETLKIFCDAGAEAVVTTDDIADSHGPFISPKLFREIIKPRLEIFVNTFKNRGIPCIKHTDGAIKSIINDFIDVGFAGLHPIEPQSMDIGEVKREYGDKICLLGNVDCTHTLPFGTVEDVRKEVRNIVDKAAYGGGFVLMSSNSIHHDCKIENVMAMVDEARKYGIYPIKG